MGVPVVTLRGDRHAGRVGASLLSQVGLTDLIANSVEEYVEIAHALAVDPERLLDLRRTLRPRLAASPLCDGPAFAQQDRGGLSPYVAEVVRDARQSIMAPPRAA
jgi:predicted O-linked N-acetylglucosamine transferase (SPINDLY family)